MHDVNTCDLAEKFAVMLQQESTDYMCRDYLADPPPAIPREMMTRNSKFSVSSLNGCNSMLSSSSSSLTSLNELWREKICEWSYQVVDHYDLSKEVVSISLNYLDRFLVTRRVNKKVFQLAAMTTLYLAIKVHEPGKMRMSSLIELSRGIFHVEHVSAMEEEILSALSWLMHPPTPMTQIRHLLLMLPSTCNDKYVKNQIADLACFLSELSVCHYYFVSHKSSSIALASILTAMEAVEDSPFISKYKSEFLKNVRNIAKIDADRQEILECQIRLREIYYEQGYNQHQDETDMIEEHKSAERLESNSPVNVTSLGQNGTYPHDNIAGYSHSCHQHSNYDVVVPCHQHQAPNGNKKARQV